MELGTGNPTLATRKKTAGPARFSVTGLLFPVSGKTGWLLTTHLSGEPDKVRLFHRRDEKVRPLYFCPEKGRSQK